VTGLSVEFNDDAVRRILGIAIDDTSAGQTGRCFDAHLPLGGGKAVGALDTSKVGLLEERLNAVGRVQQDLTKDPPAGQSAEPVEFAE
jgi:hypothetical protein